jgi:hypothetical protein
MTPTFAYIINSLGGPMHKRGLERRGRRSEEHCLALRYQLESTRERGRLSALALTDEDGLLLAWAGENTVCEELGAVAPLIARGAQIALEATQNDPDEVVVRSIDCFGEPLFLASLGGGVAREALLAHSARGIQRILTSN